MSIRLLKLDEEGKSFKNEAALVDLLRGGFYWQIFTPHHPIPAPQVALPPQT